MDILVSVLDILSLAILLWIIRFYSHPEETTKLPGWMRDENPLMPVALFFLFFTIKNAAAYLLQRAEFCFVYRVAARLSEKNLQSYLQGDYQDYAGTDSSVHIRRISQHPIEFAHYVLSGIQQLITQSMLVLASLVAILWFDAKLFALLFVILVPPVLLIAFLSRKRMKAARTQTKSTSERSLQYLKEGLAGYIESSIYRRQDFFVKRYFGWQQQLNDQLAGLQSVQGLSGRLLEVVAVLGLFILLLINKWAGPGAAFDIVVIGAFMAAAYKIIPGIVKLLNHSGQIRAYAFTVNDLLEKMQAADGSVNNEGPVDEIGSLEFRNVSFSYGDKKVISQLNFSAGRGNLIGISGISGRGKTTLLNLLLGFANQDAGEILFNEMPADLSKRKQYQARISYVKQQAFLIHDTVRCNITLEDKEEDKTKLQHALEVTGLDELLKTWPEGLDKLVTENGKNISGGQRQRIVIARAIYRDADLVILDEPFNELDKASESLLLQHFREMANAGKIVLLVTHNHDCFSFCNKIIALDEDRPQ